MNATALFLVAFQITLPVFSEDFFNSRGREAAVPITNALQWCFNCNYKLENIFALDRISVLNEDSPKEKTNVGNILVYIGLGSALVGLLLVESASKTEIISGLGFRYVVRPGEEFRTPGIILIGLGAVLITAGFIIHETAKRRTSLIFDIRNKGANIGFLIQTNS